MNLTQRWIVILLLFVSASGLTVPAGAPADDPVAPDKSVQGKWVRYQPTANGPVKIVKEHKGQRTVLTAYDDKQNVLYAHESEFKVSQSDKIRILTFFNRTITAGPNAGQTLKEPASFAYRIVDNRFIEVRGILEGDANPPSMIIWERAQEEPKENNAT